jgi:hypothetical protein
MSRVLLHSIRSPNSDIKPWANQITFKHSVRTSKKTQHLTITTINWLMPFREIFYVFYEKTRKEVASESRNNRTLSIS